MRIARGLAVAIGAIAVTAMSLTPAQAEGEFSVTANGVANRGTITDLPATSPVSLAVTNLPATVGLYAFHCLVPPPGASPVPTRCDSAADALIYIPATGAAQTVTRPIQVNAQFIGSNPNPMSGDSGTTNVDCRAQTCAIYTLGAGRESANPAYVRFFATQFAAVGPQSKDWAVATIRGQVIKNAWEPKVSYSKTSPFVVTLKSGLKASLSSNACQVSKAGSIRALKKKGTCTVTITSSGNDEWAPFARQITFRLVK
jgi:hypothetical protein